MDAPGTTGTGTYEPIQTYQEYQDTGVTPGSSRSALMAADGGSSNPPPAEIRPNKVLDVSIPGELEAQEISTYMRVSDFEF